MKAQGFSFCELLAVCGMLALIMSLTLPTILGALEVGRQRSLLLMARQLETMLAETALCYQQQLSLVNDGPTIQSFDDIMRYNSEMLALTPWIENGVVVEGVYVFQPDLQQAELLDYSNTDLASWLEHFRVIYKGEGRFYVDIIDKRS